MIGIKETTTYWIGAAVMAGVGIHTWVSKPFQSVEGATIIVGAACLTMAIQSLHHVHLVQNPRTKYLENSNAEDTAGTRSDSPAPADSKGESSE